MGVNGHVDAQLLAYVERRLAADERARVQAHLAVCAGCRAAAAELAHTVDALQGLPGALRGLPARAAHQWPAVWVNVLAAGTARKVWPHVSLYLSLVTTFLAFVLVAPGQGRPVPASVTAGVAAGPRLTQPATFVYQPAVGPTESAATFGLAVHGGAEATVAGTRAIQPIPIPTPAPDPQG